MSIRPLLPPMARLREAVLTAGFVILAGIVHGQSFTDLGFESYTVSSGGFVKPTSGPWQFTNDAGVVEPFASNSSTGVLYTWSATFPALEGQQYASTYGVDSLRQSVSFSLAGTYRISAYAAVPDGSVAIPPLGSISLQDGEFTFVLTGSPIGVTNVVSKGSSWNLYSAVFDIGSPGSYLLGIVNTKTAPYFINYDDFAIQAVPEPTTFQLLLAYSLVLTTLTCAHRWHH
jgi:hypothetical protein